MRGQKREKQWEKIKGIKDTWQTNTEIYPEKSTPSLIQMTAELFGIEYMDVVEALSKTKHEN